MISLPLYRGDLRSTLERESPLPVDHNCTRCKFAERQGLTTRCISDEGEPGGLLLIGESPGFNEDQHGRPFIGPSGKYLRAEVAKHWKGPVAIANGIRCFPPKDATNARMEKAANACRPYLAETLREAKPTRVVTLGGWAAYSVFGRSVAPYSSRRAYGWLANSNSGLLNTNGSPHLSVVDVLPLIPVFFVIHPAAALRNRFVRQWFEADLKWALTCPTPEQPPWGAVTNVVMSVEDAREAVAVLRSGRWVSFDTETFGRMVPGLDDKRWARALDRLTGKPLFRVTAASLTCEAAGPTFTWSPEALQDPEVRQPLLDLLEDPQVKKTEQNGKYDNLSMRSAYNIQVRNTYADTRLWRKLLEPEADAKLASQAELVGMGGHKEEAKEALDKIKTRIRQWLTKNEPGPLRVFDDSPCELTDDEREWLRNVDRDMYDAYAYGLLPRELLMRYNALDSLTTARLTDLLEDRMCAEPELSNVWTTIARPASWANERVEAWGIAVDEMALRAFGAMLSLRISEVQERFALYPDLNPNSPASVAKLLYSQLGLVPPKLTKLRGAPSTDKEALNELKGQHPIVDDLINYRRFVKLKGTYAEGLLPHVRADGRAHPSVNLDGARSGRPSCDNPNLYNIPRAKTPEGKMARDVFVAPQGYKLVQLDYSQLELRVAAMLSGDPEMRKLYDDLNVDFHQAICEYIAPIVWKIQANSVTEEHRSKTKNFNFGVIYGMGDEAIAARGNCSLKEAALIRNAIMGRFKRLPQWIDERIAETTRTGYTWTHWNGKRFRRRPMWRIADGDDKARSQAENGAYNTDVQGTATEFCTASLIKTVEWIDQTGIDAKVVVSVYDSIMLEVREDLVPAVIDKVSAIMLQWPTDFGHGPVKMKVDAEVGQSWGSLAKWKKPQPVAQ